MNLMSKYLIVLVTCIISLFLSFNAGAKSGFSDGRISEITELPVKFSYSSKNHQYSEEYLVLNAFDITSFETLDNGSLRMHYSIEYESHGTLSLKIKSYYFTEERSLLRATTDIDLNEKYVDVPADTCWFAIVPKNNNPGNYSVTGSFYYCNQVVMYDISGKSKFVWEPQVNRYVDYGWDLPVTLYAVDGRTVDVAPWSTEDYLRYGWYKNKRDVMQTIYSRDGDTMEVFKGKLGDYLSAGWKTEPYVTLYALDGKITKVVQSQVDSYLTVGWYKNKSDVVQTVYSKDGSTIEIYKAFLNDYLVSGWKTEPYITTLYSLDGETIIVQDAQVDSYLANGWYKKKSDVVQLIYSGSGSTMQVYKAYLENYLQHGWSLEPFVTLYALDGETLNVQKNDVDKWLNLGWYKNKSDVTMKIYSPAGSSYDIYKGYLDYFLGLGWGTEPFVTLYSLSGKIVKVCETELDSYLSAGWYENYDDVVQTIYSPEGKSMKIYKAELMDYLDTGWGVEPFVTLYALDGRTVAVPISKEGSYISAGWYKSQDYVSILNKFNMYYNAGFYREALDVTEFAESKFKNTEYEYPLSVLRNKAKDAWRSEIDCPMAWLNYSFSKNSRGTPTVTLTFKNISYKNIVAFKVKFDCYNIFNEYEGTDYGTYYTDNAMLDVNQKRSYTWTLDGAQSVHTVKNLRLTKIVFDDGTMWY